MPLSSCADRVPSYRRHKPSGQAVVTLAGRDIYLGKWNTRASRAEYDRLVGEWLAGGRCLPPQQDTTLSVAELIVRYLRFAKGYYRKNGRPSGSLPGIRVALRILRQTYGPVSVAQFGPLSLKAIQEEMIGMGHSRTYVNDNIGRIRRLFRWGVGQELAPAMVLHALEAVPGLCRGRRPARGTVTTWRATAARFIARWTWPTRTGRRRSKTRCPAGAQTVCATRPRRRSGANSA